MKHSKVLYFTLALSLSCSLALRLYALEIPLEGTTGVINGGAGTTNIGYVDIEKVFAEHPMTARMQDEFKAEIEKQKTEIANIESSIADMQRVVASSTTEANQARSELESLKNSSNAEPRITGTPAPLMPGTTAAATMPLLPGLEVSSPTAPVPAPAQIPQPPAQPQTSNASALIAAKEKEIKEKTAGIETMNQEILKKKEEIKQKKKQIKDDLVTLVEKKTNLVLNDIYKILERIASDENMTIIIDKNYVLYGQPEQDITARVLDRLRGR